jgi:hypothetical protein
MNYFERNRARGNQITLLLLFKKSNLKLKSHIVNSVEVDSVDKLMEKLNTSDPQAAKKNAFLLGRLLLI